MANSRRWKSLERQVGALRGHFLPDPFDPLGHYADAKRVQAHTRAFLVLGHAEIETFLEEWAKEIARACEQVWTTANKTTSPFTYLVATLSERIAVPDSLSGGTGKDSPTRLSEASIKLFQRYYKGVKDNHGVKEQNVLALLGPLGVPASALGSTLLPNLNSLGTLRGEHAHQSARAVQSVLDPETEHGRVMRLIGELQALDAWLVRYRRQIR
jgi:hypothetical protein